MEIKFNMLSKKRKHEESLNDIIKKDFDNSKDDNIINNNDENNVIEENEDKGQKIKKDKKNKKEEKKDFEENEVNSIKKEDILEEKNNNINEENKIENSDKKNNSSEKKKKQDNNLNNNILNYFKPKIKTLPSLSQSNDLITSNSSFTFGRNNSNFENEINNKEENLNNNLLINNNENEENKNFPFEINKNFISLKSNILNQTLPEEIKNYYSLPLESTTKEIYLLNLQNYCSLIKKYQKENHKKKENSMKLIYIHDSFFQNKKIPEIKSSKIKGKNPFLKDEYIIDYEKDSEDEFMEENAEDIKSSDKEDEEEEEENEDEKEEINKFIVPDGHLSDDEISEKDILEEKKLFEKSKGKIKSIKNILNVRNDYKKPLVIDFKREIKNNDDKYNLLINKLTISIFNNYNNKDEFDNIIYEEDEDNINKEFPIKLNICKQKKNLGYKGSIKKYFEDIIKAIHGSFDTKEQITIMLNNKFHDLSKNSLYNFFRDKCIKYKHNVNQKRDWIVKHDSLKESNLSQSDIQDILNKNFLEFEEKEKKRLEDVEINRQKNGIEVIEKKNENKEKENNNNSSEKKMIKKRVKVKKENKEEVKEKKEEKEENKEEDENEEKKDKIKDKIFEFEKVYKNKNLINNLNENKEGSEKKERKKRKKKIVLNNMLITNFNLLQNKKIPDNKNEEFIIEINNNNMDLDIEEEKN